MFGLLSKAEQTKIIEENKKLQADLDAIKEKYQDGKVYTKEQYDYVADEFERYKKNVDENQKYEHKLHTQEIEERDTKISKLQTTLEGREAALLVLASEMNVDDIEYFIRKDIKGFEDFKNDFIKKMKDDNETFTAKEKAKLQKEYLEKQSELLTGTAALVFNRNFVGKALGNQVSSPSNVQ